MIRLSFSEYLLEIARTAALRSTCCLRSVGAAVADKQRMVRGTGYNGPPRGQPHCSDSRLCDPSVPELRAPATYQVCLAVHAEVNALMIAGNAVRGGTLAITVQPCRECAKIIVNAGIARVVCGEAHRLYGDNYVAWPAQRILEHAGIETLLII